MGMERYQTVPVHGTELVGQDFFNNFLVWCLASPFQKSRQ